MLPFHWHGCSPGMKQQSMPMSSIMAHYERPNFGRICILCYAPMFFPLVECSGSPITPVCWELGHVWLVGVM